MRDQLTLYHGAEPRRAARIVAQGFSEADESTLDSGARCGVLLTVSPEPWGFPGVEVVEVQVALSLEDLGWYIDPETSELMFWVPATRCRGAIVALAEAGSV